MKSIFGLDQNIAAAISYLFGFFSGIPVLIMERENKFVRFHALQSTLWSLFAAIVAWVLGRIASLPFVGWIFGQVINPVLAIGTLAAFVLILFLAYKAYNNENFKLPFIGDVAWAQINK